MAASQLVFGASNPEDGLLRLPPSIFWLKPTKAHHIRWSEALVLPRVKANKNGGLRTSFWGLNPENGLLRLPPSIFWLKPTKAHHMRWSEALV